MPLYEYKCDSCGCVFEVMQKFSDPPLEVHQGCGGRVERLISPPAFQFKGSGWYVTDYGRKGGGNGSGGARSKESASPKTEAAGEAKTESKSETKSEAKPAAEAKK
jgi:putative FmdB family regulatory protein